jgi:hypothetical protein
MKLAQLDAAQHRLAELDRELANLQRQLRRPQILGLSRSAVKALKAEAELVRGRRELAHLELLELVELAETPIAEMGRA